MGRRTTGRGARAAVTSRYGRGGAAPRQCSERPRRPCAATSAASGAKSRCKSWSSSGTRSSSARDRQADDVEVVAVDAARPARRRGPGWRSRRRARATRRLPRTSRRRPASSARKVTSVTRDGLAHGRRDHAQAADDLVRAPGQRAAACSRACVGVAPACRRSGRRARPSVSTPSTERRPAPPRAPCAGRSRAPPRAGRRSSSSSTSAGPHLERDAELLEDRAPLRRARGEDERQASSGRRAATSRVAGLGGVRAVDHVLADLDARSRRGSSPARPRAGWSRRSPGARP